MYTSAAVVSFWIFDIIIFSLEPVGANSNCHPACSPLSATVSHDPSELSDHRQQGQEDRDTVNIGMGKQEIREANVTTTHSIYSQNIHLLYPRSRERSRGWSHDRSRATPISTNGQMATLPAVQAKLRSNRRTYGCNMSVHKIDPTDANLEEYARINPDNVENMLTVVTRKERFVFSESLENQFPSDGTTSVPPVLALRELISHPGTRKMKISENAFMPRSRRELVLLQHQQKLQEGKEQQQQQQQVQRRQQQQQQRKDSDTEGNVLLISNQGDTPTASADAVFKSVADLTKSMLTQAGTDTGNRHIGSTPGYAEHSNSPPVLHPVVVSTVDNKFSDSKQTGRQSNAEPIDRVSGENRSVQSRWDFGDASASVSVGKMLINSTEMASNIVPTPTDVFTIDVSSKTPSPNELPLQTGKQIGPGNSSTDRKPVFRNRQIVEAVPYSLEVMVTLTNRLFVQNESSTVETTKTADTVLGKDPDIVETEVEILEGSNATALLNAEDEVANEKTQPGLSYRSRGKIKYVDPHSSRGNNRWRNVVQHVDETVGKETVEVNGDSISTLENIRISSGVRLMLDTTPDNEFVQDLFRTSSETSPWPEPLTGNIPESDRFSGTTSDQIADKNSYLFENVNKNDTCILDHHRHWFWNSFKVESSSAPNVVNRHLASYFICVCYLAILVWSCSNLAVLIRRTLRPDCRFSVAVTVCHTTGNAIIKLVSWILIAHCGARSNGYCSTTVDLVTYTAHPWMVLCFAYLALYLFYNFKVLPRPAIIFVLSIAIIGVTSMVGFFFTNRTLNHVTGIASSTLIAMVAAFVSVAYFRFGQRQIRENTRLWIDIQLQADSKELVRKMNRKVDLLMRLLTVLALAVTFVGVDALANVIVTIINRDNDDVVLKNNISMVNFCLCCLSEILFYTISGVVSRLILDLDLISTDDEMSMIAVEVERDPWFKSENKTNKSSLHLPRKDDGSSLREGESQEEMVASNQPPGVKIQIYSHDENAVEDAEAEKNAGSTTVSRDRSMLFNDNGFVRFRRESDPDDSPTWYIKMNREDGSTESPSSDVKLEKACCRSWSRASTPLTPRSFFSNTSGATAGSDQFFRFHPPSIHLQESIDRALDRCSGLRVVTDGRRYPGSSPSLNEENRDVFSKIAALYSSGMQRKDDRDLAGMKSQDGRDSAGLKSRDDRDSAGMKSQDVEVAAANNLSDDSKSGDLVYV